MKHIIPIIYLTILISLSKYTSTLLADVTSITVDVKAVDATDERLKIFDVTGNISSDREGVVEFLWQLDNGFTTGSQTLYFRAPGTQQVQRTWTIGAEQISAAKWIAINVLSPNIISSAQVAFESIIKLEPEVVRSQFEPFEIKGPLETKIIQTSTKPAPPGLVRVWTHVEGFGSSVIVTLYCPKGKYPVNWGWDNIHSSIQWTLIGSAPVSGNSWRFHAYTDPVYWVSFPWDSHPDGKRKYGFNFYLYCDDCAEPPEVAPGQYSEVNADGLTSVISSVTK